MSSPADAGAGPALPWPDGVLAWKDALLAAAAVEAASGFLAAAVVACWPGPVAFFVACATAALAADAALVPGWLWAPGPFAPLALLWRATVAGGLLAVAALVGFALGVTILLLPLSFPAAGAIAGLGAVAAQSVDWRHGADTPPRARATSHVIGGAAGVIGIFAAAAAFGLVYGSGVGRLGWLAALLLLGPAALVVSAIPHNVLAVRDAQRAGFRPPPKRLARRRAAACCAAAVLLGAAALLVSALVVSALPAAA